MRTPAEWNIYLNVVYMHMSHTSAHMLETYAYTRNTTHVRFMHVRVCICVCMRVWVCVALLFRVFKLSSTTRGKGRTVEWRCRLPTT